MPWSIAFLAASSAASCAANGVDLREPLKPRTPADDHETTFPLTSVIVTMVLLNVDWMWQMPLWTFFFVFFLATLAISQIPRLRARRLGAGARSRTHATQLTLTRALAR